MRSRTCLALTFLLVLLPAPLSAQGTTRPAPRVEIGAHVGDIVNFNRLQAGEVTGGPAVTINFRRGFGLEIGADVQINKRNGISLDVFGAALKRTIHQFRSASLSALVGGGGARQTVHEVQWLPGPGGIHQVPGPIQHKNLAVAMAGLAFDEVFTPHLALQFSVQLMYLSLPDSPSNTRVRLMGGVLVPLGSYLVQPRAAVASPQGPDSPLKVRAGRKVWVTMMDGREIEGRVRAVSPAGLEVVDVQGTIQSIALAAVRKVEGPDSLQNGVLIGMLVGGIAGGVPAAVISASWGDGPIKGAGIFMFVGMGVGALIGAAGDSMKEGRQTLYEAPGLHTITAVPIVTRHGAGIGAVIRW